MRRCMGRWSGRVRAAGDSSGQALVEYALLVAAVATLAVSAALLFGPSLEEALGRVGVHLQEQSARLGGSTPGSPSGGGGGGGSGGGDAPPPGNGPGSGNNPGVGNPGNGSGIGSGNNPGQGRGR